MSQTFLFEELDETTHGYLMTVRATKGHGMPGMFAPTTSTYAGCGLLAGLGIVIATLVVTLTSWLDEVRVVCDEPIRVALLQTAGLMVGGWLILAFFRTRGTNGNARIAGEWVYMDPLHLYVARQEQVVITPVHDVEEANFTHRYNNGKYQHSVVKVLLGNGKTISITLNKESKAEQLAAYVNYLSWARSGDGGEVADLPPAKLGAVARHVARNGDQPLDPDGTLDLNLVHLDIEEIPEEPKRAGRAAPSILPYFAMVLVAGAIFVLGCFVVNPVTRDNAIYSDVMTTPTEPRFLRIYLMDPRNTIHREEVLAALSNHYRGVILHVTNKAQQPDLRSGMIKILNSLREDVHQPVVSLQVTERSPARISNGAPERVKKLREGLVGGDGPQGRNRDGILDVFATISPAITIPNVTIKPTPPPIGHQLIAFVEKPDDAKHAHFEITYEFKPVNENAAYLLAVNVTIRETPDREPVAVFAKDLSIYKDDEKELTKAIGDLKSTLVQWLVGIPENMPKP